MKYEFSEILIQKQTKFIDVTCIIYQPETVMTMKRLTAMVFSLPGLSGRKRLVFLSLTHKNFIWPLSINNEYPKSQFTLNFNHRNLRAIWAILYFSGHEP